MSKPTVKNSSTAYEWKVVLLMAMGFGLVGLDRWIITPMFPVMMGDLHLDYQDLGNIIAVLGLSWGVFSIVMGSLSDKFGRRKVLIPSIILFSLLSILTGLAGGLASLLLIRAVMGVTEGSFSPASVAVTAEVSKEKRRGFNMGLQQSTFALFGLGFGPIIATQLLRFVPSWHWVFAIVAVPGFIVGFFIYKVVREPQVSTVNSGSSAVAAPKLTASPAAAQPGGKPRFIEIFRHRNILLCMFALCGAMTCIFVLGSMFPSYLTDYLKLSVTQMGFITSAIGFGAFFGQLAIPGLSDRFGRKTVTLCAMLLTLVMLGILIGTGASPMALFALLFMTAFGCNGCLPLLSGTITIESVPAPLISTAAGVIIGVGEIFGGGVAPSLAGFIAKNYGIENTLLLAIGGIVVCLLLCLFLKETAPSRIRAGREPQASGHPQSAAIEAG
ncbi:MFS transporter [Paenibacillus physcomitrellae]|uniref:MFS transporter n=1 Tax=Paenibacillus physcomitrellae TaxID=1619311 RepID=A0ABQ1GLB9_9BACL|nr:MFS transporter [Paenibacillus physcomitrellae]GGA46102.1 MFS transporter [Paenibacillus physcomitrellae]